MCPVLIDVEGSWHAECNEKTTLKRAISSWSCSHIAFSESEFAKIRLSENTPLENSVYRLDKTFDNFLFFK